MILDHLAYSRPSLPSDHCLRRCQLVQLKLFTKSCAVHGGLCKSRDQGRSRFAQEG